MTISFFFCRGVSLDIGCYSGVCLLFTCGLRKTNEGDIVQWGNWLEVNKIFHMAISIVRDRFGCWVLFWSFLYFFTCWLRKAFVCGGLTTMEMLVRG